MVETCRMPNDESQFHRSRKDTTRANQAESQSNQGNFSGRLRRVPKAGGTRMAAKQVTWCSAHPPGIWNFLLSGYIGIHNGIEKGKVLFGV